MRVELGMKDFEKQEVRVAVRHNGEKFQASWGEFTGRMTALIDTIHSDMYAKAEAARDSHLKNIDNWKDFMDALNNRNIVLADWCDTKACEEKIGNQSKAESEAAMAEEQGGQVLLTGAAKTLCIPYKMGRQASGNPNAFDGVKCFYCGEQAKVTALWGRSY